MYLYLSNNFGYSTEYDDEDIEDEEDVIDSFAESKLGLDDIEDKEKMEGIPCNHSLDRRKTTLSRSNVLGIARQLIRGFLGPNYL